MVEQAFPTFYTFHFCLEIVFLPVCVPTKTLPTGGRASGFPGESMGRRSRHIELDDDYEGALPRLRSTPFTLTCV